MLWIWIGFILFVLIMLALDLGVFHRKRARSLDERGPHLVGGLDRDGAGVQRPGQLFGYEHHWMGLGTNPSEPLDGGDAMASNI